jgi:hypothetical protein
VYSTPLIRREVELYGEVDDGFFFRGTLNAKLSESQVLASIARAKRWNIFTYGFSDWNNPQDRG